ncbi:MAG TPA: glycoside hydrolase domain-containing protein [Bacillota bacterium]|nr:glycoside hydrolase domain-containing protein [Bacillota bacterium]
MRREKWGVDSASAVTESLYRCVVEQLGKPDFWGRYLTTVPNSSQGLSKEEIRIIHQHRIKILPIYNAFRQAIGYQQGQITAQNALFHLGRLGVPKGTVCFGNIEHFFEIDEAWIRGWVDKFYPSGYRPGLYHDPVRGNFAKAYCEAAANHSNVSNQLILWSAQPAPGGTNEQDAPTYHPSTPPCTANVWAWQYGRDVAACPVDTNLIQKRLFEHLW